MEGKQHRQGVIVLQKIAEDQGWTIKRNCNERGLDGWKFFEHGVKVDWQKALWSPIVDCFVMIPCVATFDGVIFTSICPTIPHILEVNGMKSGQGHNSPHAVTSDQRRYAWFRDNLGILTTPFKTSELVGKDTLSKEQILEAIRHTLESGQIRQL